MKFFFPDSQDQIGPFFNFESEEHPIHRVRQRDDWYAHEALRRTPYDGMLVSKAIVDGVMDRGSKFTEAQRERIYRTGAHNFYRLKNRRHHLEIMGDCGAFAYVGEEEPPYSLDEVIGFYEGVGLDLGVSMDHIVFGYLSEAQKKKGRGVEADWVRRQQLTVEIAAEFYKLTRKQGCGFTPIAVAHGWSPESYQRAVKDLQKIGYQRIALGGMVPLRSNDVLDVVSATADVRKNTTEFHLLGLTRTEFMSEFANGGVTSFDSTSPFRQSFMDDKDNYYTLNSTFVALRVPQPHGNPALKRRIHAGEVDQQDAVDAEQQCLKTLRSFDTGKASVDRAVAALRSYEMIYDTKERDRSDSYRRTLEAAPWKSCKCGICQDVGIEVMIFRGAERNKRRGFHNLAVFKRRLNRTIPTRR